MELCIRMPSMTSLFFEEGLWVFQKQAKTTAHMWQFYRKYIGLRETELKTLVFVSTYINDDLGRTLLII